MTGLRCVITSLADRQKIFRGVEEGLSVPEIGGRIGRPTRLRGGRSLVMAAGAGIRRSPPAVGRSRPKLRKLEADADLLGLVKAGLAPQGSPRQVSRRPVRVYIPTARSCV